MADVRLLTRKLTVTLGNELLNAHYTSHHSKIVYCFYIAAQITMYTMLLFVAWTNWLNWLFISFNIFPRIIIFRNQIDWSLENSLSSFQLRLIQTPSILDTIKNTFIPIAYLWIWCMWCSFRTLYFHCSGKYLKATIWSSLVYYVLPKFVSYHFGGDSGIFIFV